MFRPTRPHPSLVVAVDCSTTAVKAIAFDRHGAIAGAARAALETASPRPGWQEQEAGSWWTATCEALRQLSGGIDVARVGALAITHQRETFVCLGEDGQPLRPAILWLDSRAGAQVEALGSDEVHRISGRPPSTTTSFYKLAWLAEHEPGLLERTSVVADVHAYLVHALSGEWVTSWASADPTGLVDIRTFDYSAPLLGQVGLSEDQLPRLVPPGTIVGQLGAAAARETGLRAGTALVAGAGDGQCAGLGAAVTQTGEGYLNLGTSVTMGVHADAYRIGRAFRTLASPIPGRWTLEAALASGVHSLEWFRRHVLRDTSDVALASLETEAAAVGAGADGLLFLPYLVRAETPYWDSDARGAWVGLRDHHGLGHLYRAVLEGIAYEQQLVLSLIEQETGCATTRLRVMGGGARSALWTRLLADIFEQRLEVTEHKESTALGAAVLAAAAVGLAGEPDVAATAKRMSQGWRPLLPDMTTRSRYRRTADAYRELYPALAGVFRQLRD